MKKIINNIRLLRKLKDFSQEYIAFELGLSQSQYSRRENGTIQFSLPEIIKLASIFKVDPNTLIQNDVASGYIENKNLNESKQELNDSVVIEKFDIMTDFIVNTFDLIIQSECDITKKNLMIVNLKKRINLFH
jgi:transcriptional regulator with XRE-family HTH domain